MYLVELLRVAIAVDRVHGDALLAHLGAVLGGHRFRPITTRHEVELPRFAPPLLAIPASDEPRRELGVVLACVGREDLGPGRARPLLDHIEQGRELPIATLGREELETDPPV